MNNLNLEINEIKSSSETETTVRRGFINISNSLNVNSTRHGGVTTSNFITYLVVWAAKLFSNESEWILTILTEWSKYFQGKYRFVYELWHK